MIHRLFIQASTIKGKKESRTKRLEENGSTLDDQDMETKAGRPAPMLYKIQGPYSQTILHKFN